MTELALVDHPEDDRPIWMTRQQIADHLDVNTSTIDRWRKTEGMPHVKRAGTVRFDRRLVDAWLSEQRAA